jgi:dienelactone hydrolase
MPAAGFELVSVETIGGRVDCRYHPVPARAAGVLWVGGVGGGWDEPSRGLYGSLARSLADIGIASLRIRFRRPTHLGACVADVLAGLTFLESEGVRRVALVGHSVGGAVVLRAAQESDTVVGIVTLAAQESGAGAVEELTPECGFLFVHGTGDTVLSAASSSRLYTRVQEPRDLHLVHGGDHVLDDAAVEVHRLVGEWLLRCLAPPAEAVG